MSMSEMVDVISREFEDALEVKNPKSLHRGIFLLLSSSVPREEHLVEHNDFKTSIMALNNNVELIAVRMEEGFKRMDERFEASDKRFESIEKRFESVESRLDKLSKQMFRFMIWSFGTTATASGLIIAVLKLT
jgi:hypothetical protein